MQTDSRNSIIAHAVERQVVPWVGHWGMKRVFRAFESYDAWRQADVPLPEGSSLTHQPLKSQRVLVNAANSHNFLPGVEAVWPKDRLWSVKKPRFCFILSGAVAFQIANYVFHCKPGHGIFIPAGVPFPDGSHTCLEKNEIRREILVITPLSCWISRRIIDEEGSLRTSADNSSYPQSQIADYISQFAEEVLLRDKNSEAICQGLLAVIVNLLHRELRAATVYQTGAIEERERIGPAGGYQSAIKRAQKYIIRHLRRSPRIGEVAQYVYMSKTTFAERFRQETGMSFSEFLNHARVAEAKELLGGTRLRIDGISGQLGISPRRLRILFQQKTGMSPAQYRRHMQNQEQVMDSAKEKPFKSAA